MLLFLLKFSCRVKYISESFYNPIFAEPLIFKRTVLKETTTELDEHCIRERLYIRPAYDHEMYLGLDVDDYIEATPGKPIGGNIKLIKTKDSGYFMYVDNKQVCHKENAKLKFCSSEPNLTSIIQFIKKDDNWLISSGKDTSSHSACLTLLPEFEKDKLEFRFCDGSHLQLFNITRYPNMREKKFENKPKEFDVLKNKLFNHG